MKNLTKKEIAIKANVSKQKIARYIEKNNIKKSGTRKQAGGEADVYNEDIAQKIIDEISNLTDSKTDSQTTSETTSKSEQKTIEILQNEIEKLHQELEKNQQLHSQTQELLLQSQKLLENEQKKSHQLELEMTEFKKASFWQKIKNLFK